MLQRVFVVLTAIAFSLGAHAKAAAPASAACPASSESAAAAPLAKYKATPAPVLKPTAAQGQAAILSARLLTRFQYEALPLDDAMSGKIFDAYFKALDGSRLFFTQADIDQFTPDRAHAPSDQVALDGTPDRTRDDEAEAGRCLGVALEPVVHGERGGRPAALTHHRAEVVGSRDPIQLGEHGCGGSRRIRR